jgi:hypothetical protein
MAVGAPAMWAVLAACSAFSGDDPAIESDAATDAGPDAPVADASAQADAMTGSTYRDLVMADSPLAYWRMGAKTGLTIHDETGRSSDLVLQGTNPQKLGVEGAIAGDDDTAVRFDGIDGHARPDESTAFAFAGELPFTLELWAKREDIDGGRYFQHMISNAEGSAGDRTGFSVYVTPAAETTTFEYDARDGGDQGISGALIPAGQWAHYAAVFENGTITVYVNATASSPAHVKGPLTLGTAAQLVVGAENGSGDYAFAGVIDEVAIYDKALTFAQIVAHRTAGRN